MKSSKLLMPLLISLAILGGCDLSKDADVELPSYQSKLVVECYLYPGQPVGLLLTESVSYLSTPEINLLENAFVTLSYQGIIDTLVNGQIGLPLEEKIFNYYSSKTVPTTSGVTYTLKVKAADGRQVMATATMLDTVAIDLIEYDLDPPTDEASVRIRWEDSPSAQDYYRVIISRNGAHNEKRVDHIISDQLENGLMMTTSTGFKLNVGDTAVARLFHIEKNYYDFLNLADDARDANGSPFNQPVSIRSNIDGGLGIFATIPSTERRKVIRK